MQTLNTTCELFHLFGDPTRLRLLALLARQELTVAELTAITELAQSRVSTHLGRLRDAGVLRDRRQGASTVYALNDGAMPAEARKLWGILEQDVSDGVLQADAARCEALVHAREDASGWPDAVAGQMERHYSPGRTWEATARALLGLLHLGDVLDVGSGDGTIAALLAPRARSVTCLDLSARVVRAGRDRLADVESVRFVRGDAHAIPAPDGRFDQVLLFNVLANAGEPGRTLGEAARVLRRGGDLVVVTLEEHPHEPLTRGYGHVHPGFRPTWLRTQLRRHGLEVDRCEVTSRERREPHFNVVTAFAHKPDRRNGRTR